MPPICPPGIDTSTATRTRNCGRSSRRRRRTSDVTERDRDHMAESRTQPDYRRNMVNTDRFGRKWLVTIELKTGDPTGLITPTSWTDPLGTPQKYLQVPRDDPRSVRILFTR